MGVADFLMVYILQHTAHISLGFYPKDKIPNIKPVLNWENVCSPNRLWTVQHLFAEQTLDSSTNYDLFLN